MYILNVTPNAPEEATQKVRAAHIDWVKEGIKLGWFVFAGPKTNERGGVIVATKIDRNTLDTFIAKDPYVKEDVVEYDIITFDAKFTTEDMLAYQD